jgi:methionine synthase II (cobalamin-independent)
MMLPTEQVGSIPRPAALIQGVQGCQLGRTSQPELDALYDTTQQHVRSASEYRASSCP